MKRLVPLMFLLIILSSFAYANAEYLEWGFGGRNINVGSGAGLWGSSSVAGSLPSQNLTYAESPTRMPIIMDLDQDQNNEVLVFTASSVKMYDNYGFEISSYVSAGGRFSGAEFGEEVRIVGLKNKSELIVLQKNNSALVLDESHEINYNDKYTLDVFCGDYTCFIPTYDGNFTKYDIETSKQDMINNTFTNRSLINQNPASRAGLDFQNYAFALDIDRDGGDEFYMSLFGGNIDGAGTCLLVYYYDENNGFENWDSILLDDFTCNTPSRWSMQTAKLGASSSYSIILGQEESGQTHYYVYDPFLNLYLEDSQASNSYFLFPSAADIDKDGFNELIIYDNDDQDIDIYDSTFTKIHDIDASGTGFFTDNNLVSAVELNDVDSSFMEFISPQGFFYVNDTNASDLNLVKTGGVPGTPSSAFPVVIKDRTNFVLDYIALSDTSFSIMFSSLVGALCGNSICEAGETAVSCPEDCAPSDPSQAVITSLSTTPCHSLPVKWNTTLGVDAVVEAADGSDVAFRSVFYNGAGYSQDSGWSNFTASGSSFSYLFDANVTQENAQLIAYAKTDTNDDLATLSFSIDVRTSGGEYLDTRCGITQPLEEIKTPANTTTIEDDNAVLNTYRTFSGLTNLGLDMLWLISMFLFAGVVFYYGITKGLGGLATLSISIIGMFIMLIIGTMLGFLSTGIMISVIIIGVVIGALWIRNMLSGSNSGGE